MTMQVLEYCARAVIRHLDGDMGLFLKYVHMASMAHRKETGIAKIGEIVPKDTQRKMYEMVS